MLRDLDQRQAPQARANAQPGDFALRRGTASLAKSPAPAQTVGQFSSRIVAAVLLVLALVLGGAYWWWLQTTAGGAPKAKVAPVAQPESSTTLAFASTLATAPVPTDSAARTPSPKAPSPAIKIAVEPTSTHELPSKARGNKPALGSASVPGSPVVAAVATVPASTSPAISSPMAASANAAAEAPGGSARQLQAGRDTLAQAQSLWNAGSRDAANELLQHALSIAERSAASAATPATRQLLATLAREQARMQIAEGRAQAALDGLSRLESVLGQDADAWALRGNAAQRLGRHQDSVNAYAGALQIRPNEQRWLLGAAVSLAALGQAANASDMAAKARAQGPISKEVQAYLRQAGVALNEP
jgi:Flp pilus assembly protein TadD